MSRSQLSSSNLRSVDGFIGAALDMLNVFNEFNQWTKPIVQQDSMLDWIKSLSPTRDKSSGKQLETVSELEPYLAHYITLKKHEQGIRVRRIGRVGDDSAESSPSRRASRRDMARAPIFYHLGADSAKARYDSGWFGQIGPESRPEKFKSKKKMKIFTVAST